MKKVLFLFFTLLTIGASAQTLKFGNDGKFKILQFTDLHTIIGDKRSDVVFANFRSTIMAEKPDLIVITGDMIYSGPGVKKLGIVLDSIDKYGIPFTLTFGNHDRQFNSTNAELWGIASQRKHFVGKSAEGVSGVGNCDLEVMSRDGKAAQYIVYCFDSHEDSEFKPLIDGYNYIKRSQIEWYVNKSSAHRAANGGKVTPAVAFFHIPLCEYTEAQTLKRDTIYGIMGEKSCPSKLNSGLFTAFKEMGDVRGIFVGHDHDNDYATSHYGILLAYGRFSGGKTEYFNLDQPGARVIELSEDSDKFNTWIRLLDGTVNQQITF